tara:strand:- start:5687 stop:8272 length:2586 start_codon:yes stop_codon:yes gene_type:complete
MLSKINGILLFFSLFLLSCSPIPDSTSGPYASRPEVRAPDAVNTAFQVQSAKVVNQEGLIHAVDRARISIKSTALEKEFLLSSNILQQSPVPMFSNQKSRVVAFKKVEDRLFMLEANDGHIVREDIPASIILAEFKILQEENDLITFDFNQGMSRLFTFSGWHATDFSAPNFTEHFQAATVTSSFIEEASLNEKDNRLFIRQVAQLGMENQVIPVETRYYLEPYRPNENFQPSRSTNFRRMGYFETAPRYNEYGTKDVWATKFDHTKKIDFAISANTPEEYKQAVRDGILYWNKAFGKEVVRAVDAPEGVTAPHPDYNVIQWVNWDTAGFAYADAQADPRTGEIKNAQVMFTSVFALSGKQRARRLLNLLKEEAGTQQRIALKGFEQKAFCFRKPSERMAAALAKVVELEDEEKIREISADYIREVVAHEVGHTLGLRHNFAGSLGMTYGADERDSLVEKYFKDFEVEETLLPSSSTMEYNAFEESAMMGNLMRSPNTTAFPYDKVAIEHLYYGKEFTKAEVPLFCTDSHVEKYIDCQRFDLFSTRSEEAKYSQKNLQKTLARRTLEAFVHAKDPQKGYRKLALTEVFLSPKAEAMQLLAKAGTVMELLSKETKLLSVHRSYDVVDELNQAVVRQANFGAAEADILSTGGLRALIQPLPENFGESEFQKFKTLLLKEENRKGKGPGGNGYEFNQEDLDIILARAALFYEQLDKAARRLYLEQLNQATNLANTELSEDFADLLEEQARHYLLSTSGEDLVSSITDKENKILPISVPTFTYNPKIRKMAANLLRKGRSRNPDWGFMQNHRLKQEMQELLDSGLAGKKFEDLEPEKLPQDLRQWYFENQQIFNALKTRVKIEPI